jgi:photosystem II stability/assembly factor-like uncharacterized protein
MTREESAHITVETVVDSVASSSPNSKTGSVRIRTSGHESPIRFTPTARMSIGLPKRTFAPGFRLVASGLCLLCFVAACDSTSVTDRGEISWDLVNSTQFHSLQRGAEGQLVAGSGSRIFRSVDSGYSWAQIRERGGGVIAVGPEGTLCTADWQAGFLYRDGLVYCSADSGQSWSLLPDNSNFTGADIGAISLLDDGQLLVATNGRVFQGEQALAQRGLHRSLDMGGTWSGTGLLTDDPFGGAAPLFVLSTGDVIIVRFKSEAILNNTVGFFVSTDRSATWTEWPDPPFGAIRGVARAAGGTLYAVGSEQFPGVGLVDGLYASEDLGASWRRTSLLVLDGALQDVSVASDGRVLVAAGYDGIYISDDDGVSWTPSNGGLPVSSIGTLEVAVEKLFAGPDFLFALTDGGLFRSNQP